VLLLPAQPPPLLPQSAAVAASPVAQGLVGVQGVLRALLRHRVSCRLLLLGRGLLFR
jgi:hypothetical protein